MNTATAPAPETRSGPDVVIRVDTHTNTHMAVALSANGGCLELMRLAAGFGHHQPHRLQTFKGKELVNTCAGLRSGEITTPLATAKLTLRTLRSTHPATGSGTQGNHRPAGSADDAALP
jgi:hypothetical protein